MNCRMNLAMSEVVGMKVRLMWGKLVAWLAALSTSSLPEIPTWPEIWISEIFFILVIIKWAIR